MRYFVPDIRLASELETQSGPQDKLGGLPWGLKPEYWPKCKACGKSLSLLAQFMHDAERLDLMRTGRVLYVFQCSHHPGGCATWQGGSGANACFVVEPEDLRPSLTTAPSDNPPIEREARVVEWIARDDGIPQDMAPRFFSEAAYYSLPESIIERVPWGTRLRGIPRWVQSPDEAPQNGWEFVGQLDSTYSFFAAPQGSSEGVYEDQERWEGRTHICTGPNFGDGGIAYLFIREGQTTPEGWFFWQCG